MDKYGVVSQSHAEDCNIKADVSLFDRLTLLQKEKPTDEMNHGYFEVSAC